MPSIDPINSGDPCPECGVHRVPGAKYCWLCGEYFSVNNGPADAVTAPPVYERVDISTQRSVAYLATLFGALTLIGLVACYWNGIPTDAYPWIRIVALAIVAPILAIMVVSTILAGLRNQIMVSPKTLTLGALLGVGGAICFPIFAITAITVAVFIALLVTCATSGSLP